MYVLLRLATTIVLGLQAFVMSNLRRAVSKALASLKRCSVQSRQYKSTERGWYSELRDTREKKCTLGSGYDVMLTSTRPRLPCLFLFLVFEPGDEDLPKRYTFISFTKVLDTKIWPIST